MTNPDNDLFKYVIIEKKPDSDTKSAVRQITVAEHETLRSALDDAQVWRTYNPTCIYLVRPVKR